MINLLVARMIMRLKFANNAFFLISISWSICQLQEQSWDQNLLIMLFWILISWKMLQSGHWIIITNFNLIKIGSHDPLTSYFDLTKFDLLTPSHYWAFKLLKQWAIFILCEICIFKFCPTTKIARVFLTIHLSKLWVDNSHPNWLKTGCNKTNLRGFARKVNRKIINI